MAGFLGREPLPVRVDVVELEANRVLFGEHLLVVAVVVLEGCSQAAEDALDQPHVLLGEPLVLGEEYVVGAEAQQLVQRVQHFSGEPVEEVAGRVSFDQQLLRGVLQDGY